MKKLRLARLSRGFRSVLSSGAGAGGGKRAGGAPVGGEDLDARRHGDEAVPPSLVSGDRLAREAPSFSDSAKPTEPFSEDESSASSSRSIELAELELEQEWELSPPPPDPRAAARGRRARGGGRSRGGGRASSEVVVANRYAQDGAPRSGPRSRGREGRGGGRNRPINPDDFLDEPRARSPATRGKRSSSEVVVGNRYYGDEDNQEEYLRSMLPNLASDILLELNSNPNEDSDGGILGQTVQFSPRPVAGGGGGAPSEVVVHDKYAPKESPPMLYVAHGSTGSEKSNSRRRAASEVVVGNRYAPESRSPPSPRAQVATKVERPIAKSRGRQASSGYASKPAARGGRRASSEVVVDGRYAENGYDRKSSAPAQLPSRFPSTGSGMSDSSSPKGPIAKRRGRRGRSGVVVRDRYAREPSSPPGAGSEMPDVARMEEQAAALEAQIARLRAEMRLAGASPPSAGPAASDAPSAIAKRGGRRASSEVVVHDRYAAGSSSPPSTAPSTESETPGPSSSEHRVTTRRGSQTKDQSLRRALSQVVTHNRYPKSSSISSTEEQPLLSLPPAGLDLTSLADHVMAMSRGGQASSEAVAHNRREPESPTPPPPKRLDSTGTKTSVSSSSSRRPIASRRGRRASSEVVVSNRYAPESPSTPGAAKRDGRASTGPVPSDVFAHASPPPSPAARGGADAATRGRGYRRMPSEGSRQERPEPSRRARRRDPSRDPTARGGRRATSHVVVTDRYAPESSRGGRALSGWQPRLGRRERKGRRAAESKSPGRTATGWEF